MIKVDRQTHLMWLQIWLPLTSIHLFIRDENMKQFFCKYFADVFKQSNKILLHYSFGEIMDNFTVPLISIFVLLLMLHKMFLAFLFNTSGEKIIKRFHLKKHHQEKKLYIKSDFIKDSIIVKIHLSTVLHYWHI